MVEWPGPEVARHLTSTEQIVWAHRVNKDAVVSAEDIQNYAGQKKVINVKEIYSIFQKVLPGELIIEGDESFEQFKENLEVPEKGIIVEIE